MAPRGSRVHLHRGDDSLGVASHKGCHDLRRIRHFLVLEALNAHTCAECAPPKGQSCEGEEPLPRGEATNGTGAGDFSDGEALSAAKQIVQLIIVNLTFGHMAWDGMGQHEMGSGWRCTSM